MKKHVATKLNDIADNLPQVFDWSLELEDFTGIEMNLSAFGEKEKYDNGSMYSVEVPVMRAVEHKQQVKDAYKHSGEAGVLEYVARVYQKVVKAEC